ncbi:MAG: alpha/beta hydrolase [Candidatus Omnitrophota bacterium]
MKKLSWRVLFLLFLLLISGGVCYQSAATIIDQQRYPHPGKLFDVGGYKLHLHTAGSGSPTVVMDSGLRGYSLSWYGVEAELAKITRVCTYDRAGLGWSEPGPLPRTSQQIVNELHTLLAKADIPGPYILVGHSFGGLNMRLYASQFPQEVLGLVLIDSPPDQIADYFPELMNKIQIAQRLLLNFGRLTAPIGITRLLNWPMSPLNLPGEIQPIASARGFRLPAYDTTYEETVSLPISIQQLRHAQLPSAMPIKVLIHTRPYSVFGVSAEEARRVEEVWRDLALRELSPHNIIMVKGDHNLHIKQPQIVINAVNELIEEIKAQQ